MTPQQRERIARRIACGYTLNPVDARALLAALTEAEQRLQTVTRAAGGLK